MVAAISIGFAIAVRGFVQEVILRPLFYMAWVGELFVRSMPQGVFWALLTLCAGYFAVRSLSMPRTRSVKRKEVAVQNAGPVARWQRILERGGTAGYGAWTQARAMRRLTHELLGRELTLEEESAGLEEGDLKISLPGRFQDYYDTEVQGRMGWPASWRNWLPDFLATDADLGAKVEAREIIEFLEEQTYARTRKA